MCVSSENSFNFRVGHSVCDLRQSRKIASGIVIHPFSQLTNARGKEEWKIRIRASGAECLRDGGAHQGPNWELSSEPTPG